MSEPEESQEQSEDSADEKGKEDHDQQWHDVSCKCRTDGHDNCQFPKGALCFIYQREPFSEGSGMYK